MHKKLEKTQQGLYQLTSPVSRQEFINLALSLLEPCLTGPLLDNTEAVGQYFQLQLSSPAHESVAALFFNQQMQVVHYALVHKGTVNGSIVYPRELVKLALTHNATSVIIAHNHPSGELTPSTEDIELTFHLHSALGLLDIELLDHFIVSPEGFTSFAESGLL